MPKQFHLDAIKSLRAAIKLYAPCQGCGNDACEAMHASMVESEGLVEDEDAVIFVVVETGISEELLS